MNLDQARDLIKKFEGCRLESYQDQRGIWTIGYGHTGGIQAGMKVTQDFVDHMLELDLTKTYEQLMHYVPLEIITDDNKANALASFVFNIGIGQFSKSTMLVKIKEDKTLEEIASEFDRWVFVDGAVSDGLFKRRAEEKKLFLS